MHLKDLIRVKDLIRAGVPVVISATFAALIFYVFLPYDLSAFLIFAPPLISIFYIIISNIERKSFLTAIETILIILIASEHYMNLSYSIVIEKLLNSFSQIFDLTMTSPISWVGEDRIKSDKGGQDIFDTLCQQMNTRSLPNFTNWPPPRPSASVSLPSSIVSIDKKGSLGDVLRRLDAALLLAGYSELAHFKIPCGQAIVTRIESISEDAKPKDDRWNYKLKYNMKDLSLSEYIRVLLWAPTGRYRVIAFFIVRDLFIPSLAEIDKDHAITWLNEGALGANQYKELLNFNFHESNFQIVVLIYEFYNDGTKVITVKTSANSGVEHLDGSGIIKRLKEINYEREENRIHKSGKS